MKIESIEITNIKGIQYQKFDLGLLPNKPNLLVAPNGFGKTSFSIGFQSLKKNKLELDEKHYHNNDFNNRPSIIITLVNGANKKQIVANDLQNTIFNDFDVFVINSQLMAKATKQNINGTVIARSSLEVMPITLIEKIPKEASFNYSINQQKREFGANGKILPNISEVFLCSLLVDKIYKEVNFQRLIQSKICKLLKEVKDEINQQNNRIDEIKSWIETHKLSQLQSIPELHSLSVLLKKSNMESIKTDVDSFLAAFQFVNIYEKLGQSNFKKAVNYALYVNEKEFYETLIGDFNTTRYRIRPKEDHKRGLVVEWPKAHEISNGQRDVLSFVVLLMKAKKKFTKQNSILIIDEIFDYLDDANLISFQYFVTAMIEEMKSQDKKFFPILMTHLDPLFFGHFCFNKHKIRVNYLKKTSIKTNENLVKLIKKRGEENINERVDKYYFHYHPGSIDITNEFTVIDLPKDWGDSIRFHQYISKEVDNYLQEQIYSPLAVCIGVRTKIESLVYSKLSDLSKQERFIEIHGTKKKLDYCESIGIDIPEIYYLLGIIYNDSLHWRESTNIEDPIAIKLGNLTIKRMIEQIFK